MSYFKNRGFWFWGFIILALINISVLGSMSYVMYRHTHQPDYQGFHQGFMGHHPRHNKGTRMMLKELNLNPGQRQKLQSIRKKHFAEMRQLRNQLQKAQYQFFDAVTADQPDSAIVAQYRTRITELQNKITDVSLDFYKNMKEILDPEQQEILRDFYKKRYMRGPNNQQ